MTTVADTASAADTTHHRRSLSLETLVVATLGVFGLRVGLRDMSDNSAFVHLRTGIELTRNWHIPRTDPYSFTAHGQPWTVQSWFASLLYGAAFRFAGAMGGSSARLHGVLILQGLLMAMLALVIANLARTGVATRTMLSASVAVLLGAVYWSPRPLIFGLLGLGLVVTVVERRAHWAWLFPITWVWVNTHGSFPLGLAWLGMTTVGFGLDRRRLDQMHLRYVGSFVGGLLVATLNPLGPRLLLFPFSIEAHADAFRRVVEWHSPDFQSSDGLAVLVLLSIALLIVCRGRLEWRDSLPLVTFVALALLSLRNVAPAGVVLAPVLGRALGPSSGDPRTARPPDQLRLILNRAVALALGALSLLFVLLSLRGSGLDLSTYPTAAVTWMDSRGLLDPARHRVAEQDVVGCYLILVKGTKGRVFIDDRVDMYPTRVSADYDKLLAAHPTSPAILSRYAVDVVLWDKRLALPAVLRGTGWTSVYEDRHWVVLSVTAL